MEDLSSGQCKRLRGLAHALKPVVHVGVGGLTQGVLASADAALDDHELIKVRFVDHTEDRKRLSREMATRLRGQLAGVVGHVAILYRASPDPEARRIEIRS